MYINIAWAKKYNSHSYYFIVHNVINWSFEIFFVLCIIRATKMNWIALIMCHTCDFILFQKYLSRYLGSYILCSMREWRFLIENLSGLVTPLPKAAIVETRQRYELQCNIFRKFTIEKVRFSRWTGYRKYLYLYLNTFKSVLYSTNDVTALRNRNLFMWTYSLEIIIILTWNYVRISVFRSVLWQQAVRRRSNQAFLKHLIEKIEKKVNGHVQSIVCTGTRYILLVVLNWYFDSFNTLFGANMVFAKK